MNSGLSMLMIPSSFKVKEGYGSIIFALVTFNIQEAGNINLKAVLVKSKGGYCHTLIKRTT